MSDYVYTPDERGDCLMCGCPYGAHVDNWCPDAPETAEPDPDHLRD